MRKHALRRSLLLAAATATIAAGVAVPAGPALAAGTGTITGHLTDSAGNPLAYAHVSIQAPPIGTVSTTQADAAGAYTVPGLEAGEYFVGFSPVDAAYTQYAHQKRTPGAADRVTVVAGATVVVDDQALPSGRIAGALHKRDGSPAAANIGVYTADGQNWVGSGHTAPDGTFSLELLPGSYKLNFTQWPSIAQWNGAALTYADAAAIEVVAGQATALQESLVATGSIAGRLTRADGTPAAGVTVAANWPDYAVNGHNATTDADGRYRMDDVPVSDQWIVSFTGPNYVQQYAHGKLTRADAERLTVTEGQVSTVDEQFLPTGNLRIRAHDATTGAPLSGFCAWELVAGSFSDCAQGTEAVFNDLFAGTWRFDVNIEDHQHFYVSDARATVVGGQDTILDVAMRRGATLTVPMAERDGGAAAEGCVQVAKAGDAFPPLNSKGCSDPQASPGAAVLGPLEPGAYQIFADPGDDALGAQWVGATGGTGDRDAAAQLILAAGDQVTAPVVRFDAAGSIRGKVTDVATGAPVPYTCVSVVAQTADYSGGGCPHMTGEDGIYTLSGLGPYAWPVQFMNWNYQWRWSGNKASRPEATTVTVRVGKSVAANIKLRTGGGSIAGTFTDAAGNPVDGMVVPYNAVTGEAASPGGQTSGAGTYSAPLIAPQQSVKLQWHAPGRSGWVGGADFASAASYQVKNNKTVTVNVIVP